MEHYDFVYQFSGESFQGKPWPRHWIMSSLMRPFLLEMGVGLRKLDKWTKTGNHLCIIFEGIMGMRSQSKIEIVSTKEVNFLGGSAKRILPFIFYVSWYMKALLLVQNIRPLQKYFTYYKDITSGDLVTPKQVRLRQYSGNGWPVYSCPRRGQASPLYPRWQHTQGSSCNAFSYSPRPVPITTEEIKSKAFVILLVFLNDKWLLYNTRHSRFKSNNQRWLNLLIGLPCWSWWNNTFFKLWYLETIQLGVSIIVINIFKYINIFHWWSCVFHSHYTRL